MIRVVKPNGTRLSIRKNGALYMVRLFNSIYKVDDTKQKVDSKTEYEKAKEK